MLVSVIIPAKNAAATLSRAVNSILAQDYPELEVLLVNNNSTDDTPQLIARLAEEHPARIRATDCTTPGASAARNRGLRLARGTWIQFLDADDTLAPEKISRQVNGITPETQWVIGGYRHLLPEGNIDNVPHQDPWKGLVHEFRVGCTISNLYRKTALEAIGGWDETLPDNTDPDLHFRLLAAGLPYRIEPTIDSFYHHDATGPRVSTRDAAGGNWRRAELYGKVTAFLRQHRPEYWVENADWFRGAQLAALRKLSTHDLTAADELYRKQFENGKLLPRTRHLNPGYTRLYGLLGFRNTEALRKWLAGWLPTKWKKRLKG
ncbi:glycosyltransferase family A protein [Lewinella sp. W8]|uniref:glycosyltransferase family 2 protein n=1 Tax=Lewinella sp. W8 TaxID=2528208 RepID=UPI001564D849